MPLSLRTKLTQSVDLAKEAAALCGRGIQCYVGVPRLVMARTHLFGAFDPLECTLWVSPRAGDM